MTTYSVVAPLWQDRPPSENIAVATQAADLGFRELWIGEMATYDAFALATAIGASTSMDLTIGPLAVGVRTATTMAMGVASVADLTGRTVRLAIGASSPVVVTKWHGGNWAGTATHLGETAGIVRSLLEGGRSAHDGTRSRSHGYRLRLDAPGCHLTIAAFGPATIHTAALHADRVVLNMVTPATAARLSSSIRRIAHGAGRSSPSVAVWLVASVDPTAPARDQMAAARVGYLAAPGYGEMLHEAGFGSVVSLARSGASVADVAAAIPPELDSAVGLVGSPTQVVARATEYFDAGVDEICLVPVTADDPNGIRSLSVFADR